MTSIDDELEGDEDVDVCWHCGDYMPPSQESAVPGVCEECFKDLYEPADDLDYGGDPTGGNRT